MDRSLYGVIDASANRAMEGLRVCENTLRFVLKDETHALTLKSLRHQLAAALKCFPAESLLAGRDVEGDPIKFHDLPSEKKTRSLQELLRKNLHRTMESLRTLEEFVKLLLPSGDNPFQGIRFALYSQEKELVTRLNRRDRTQRLEGALYVILDETFVPDGEFLRTAEAMLRGGAAVIQLRMKKASRGRVLEEARQLALLCREYDALFIVNDYPDIAELAWADGVHLGQGDLPIGETRRLLSPGRIIGISTHSQEEAEQALKEGPDYLAVGPVCDTRTKAGELMPGMGFDAARRLIASIPLPTVCIGGLGPENLGELMGTGCSAAAVISSAYRDGRVEENCRQMADILRKGGRQTAG